MYACVSSAVLESMLFEAALVCLFGMAALNCASKPKCRVSQWERKGSSHRC